MRALVPRIDTPDPSYGTSAPAFALSNTLAALGTEYLIMGLGAGMLGVFSLATGHLVSELYPGITPRIWGDLEVPLDGITPVRITNGTGVNGGGGVVGGGSGAALTLPGFALGHYASLALTKVTGGHESCSNAGRTLLVAAPAGGQDVFVFQLDLEAAAKGAADEAEAAAARRRSQQQAVQRGGLPQQQQRRQEQRQQQQRPQQQQQQQQRQHATPQQGLPQDLVQTQKGSQVTGHPDDGGQQRGPQPRPLQQHPLQQGEQQQQQQRPLQKDQQQSQQQQQQGSHGQQRMQRHTQMSNPAAG